MTFEIEIAYATPECQDILKLIVESNQNLLDVIKQSTILDKYPEIDLKKIALGVYGKRIYDIDKYVIQNKDRIEIYRPLITSPNQKRLERAKTK